MKSRSRRFEFHLHPAEPKHAACIEILDNLRKDLNDGKLRKGDFSNQIAEALYSYFRPEKSVKQDFPKTSALEVAQKEAEKEPELLKPVQEKNTAVTDDTSSETPDKEAQIKENLRSLASMF